MTFFVPRVTSLVLTPLLVVGPLFAQTPGSLAVPGTPGSAALQIHVMEGDGATIAPGSHSNKGFNVQVTDGAGAPVSDAAVVFRLPDGPTTGTFADGTHSMVAYTDGTGNAHVSGIQWSSTPGPLTVRVTATRGTSHAGTLIEETLANAMPVAAAAPVTSRPMAPAVIAPRAEALARDIAPPAPAAPRVQVLNDVEPSSAANRTPRTFAPVLRESGSEPTVSIVTDPHQKSHYSDGGSRKKWIIISVAVAAAGAGAFFAMHNMDGSSAANVSIGAPTINIGH